MINGLLMMQSNKDDFTYIYILDEIYSMCHKIFYNNNSHLIGILACITNHKSHKIIFASFNLSQKVRFVLKFVAIDN